MGGVNRPPDVRNVQELLNQVPPSDGGPATPLEVDGICGPKTIRAIQMFQLHHFGWSGADGRVDPDGPTLAKLNEYDGPQVLQPHVLTIRRSTLPGTLLQPEKPEHWFFEITDSRNGQRAVYHLGEPHEHKYVKIPRSFLGEVVPFHNHRGAAGFETRGASYMTIYDLTQGPDQEKPWKGKPLFSRLLLALLSSSKPTTVEKVHITYPAHMDPLLDQPGFSSRVVRTKHGRFNRVR